MQRLFHILSENDELYREWERLVVAYQVVGKAAHDARLVAAMNIHAITRILTFNPTDFRRYSEIEVIHPGDLA